MALSITSRIDRNVQVLTLMGNLTLGPTLKSLQQLARTALENGSLEALLVDVSNVKYADSAGLGELTILYSICSRKNCPLILVGVPHQLRQMLDLTRLDALLPSAGDIEAAKRPVKQKAGRPRDLNETQDAAVSASGDSDA